MSRPSAILITFGDGDFRYARASRRLVSEARATGLYEQSFSLDLQWLAKTDPELFGLINNWISIGDIKGMGYWTWKSAALLWASQRFPGRLIHYMDAGHVILPGRKSVDTLRSWLIEANEKGSLAWSLPETREIVWTKRETLELLDPDGCYFDTPQVEAGFFILKSDLGVDFAEQLRAAQTLEKGRYLTGESWLTPFPEFQSHRYDQSIQSLLWKRNGFHYRTTQTFPLEKCQAVFAGRYASGFSWNGGKNTPVRRIEFTLGKLHKAILIYVGKTRRWIHKKSR